MPSRLLRGVVAAISLAFALSITLPAYAQLSSTEDAIANAVDAGVGDEIDFLERVVNINSGTMNVAGVREVGAVFADELAALGFDTEWVDMPKTMQRAGHLVARRAGNRGKRLLLLGHIDTVFPKDSSFQKFERDGDSAAGPGISDMKSGDAIMLYALKALAEAGALDGADIKIILTGDEESAGRPLDAARAPMIALAEESDAALSFEGGELTNAVVGRRGATNWTLTVTGRRAHSSQIFSKEVGAGAIFEAARILNGFYDKVRGEEYLTFNPGLILGGTATEIDLENSRGTAFGKTNVVAQTLTVDGGLRFLYEDQKEAARAKMREIVADHLPLTDAKIEFEDRYPAMSPTAGNRALFQVLADVQRDLGYPNVREDDPGSRGAGDISFIAPIIDSLDGLGGTGSGEHSLDEKLDLTQMGPMTKRAALLIYRLTQE